MILMGTGSEVQLCVEARKKLEKYGVKARVVSMPSWELFAAQDDVLSGERFTETNQGARVGGSWVAARLASLDGRRRRGDRRGAFRCVRSPARKCCNISASRPNM